MITSRLMKKPVPEPTGFVPVFDGSEGCPDGRGALLGPRLAGAVSSLARSASDGQPSGGCPVDYWNDAMAAIVLGPATRSAPQMPPALQQSVAHVRADANSLTVVERIRSKREAILADPARRRPVFSIGCADVLTHRGRGRAQKYDQRPKQYRTKLQATQALPPYRSRLIPRLQSLSGREQACSDALNDRC